MMRFGLASLLVILLSIAFTPDVFGESVERDEEGRVVKEVEEDGTVGYLVYDALGRLVEVRKSDGSIIRYDPPVEPEE